MCNWPVVLTMSYSKPNCWKTLYPFVFQQPRLQLLFQHFRLKCLKSLLWFLIHFELLFLCLQQFIVKYFFSVFFSIYFFLNFIAYSKSLTKASFSRDSFRTSVFLFRVSLKNNKFYHHQLDIQEVIVPALQPRRLHNLGVFLLQF